MITLSWNRCYINWIQWNQVKSVLYFLSWIKLWLFCSPVQWTCWVLSAELAGSWIRRPKMIFREMFKCCCWLMVMKHAWLYSKTSACLWPASSALEHNDPDKMKVGGSMTLPHTPSLYTHSNLSPPTLVFWTSAPAAHTTRSWWWNVAGPGLCAPCVQLRWIHPFHYFRAKIKQKERKKEELKICPEWN